LSLIRTRAVAQGDGTYKLSGTKIFITYGEHDMAENIIHFVLARTPNAPEGVKGISLFIVPKILVKADGSLGERNDVECVSIEHKLGIKASPTAVLQFGDHGGAIGTLIGEENRGLEYMFIMMNAARFAVGVQGLALAERAYQKAVQYAKDRIQSRDPDGGTSAAPIIRQPDVRRMLMSMRAQTEAGRALAYVTAAAFDLAHHHPEESERNRQRAFYELMVPVVKGWCTEMSVDVASTGVQVHGGMGFVEETGAAQFYRDARILPIYEGTTAIQANDLVGRKTVRDGGAAVRDVIARITETETQLKSAVLEDIKACGIRLSEGRAALEKTVEFILANAKSEPKKVLASGVTYLKLAGIVIGGWQMARAALAAERLLQAGTGDASFCRAKIATALFFARHVLPLSSAHSIAIVEGADDSNRLADDVF
jgi:butyryl-CoA dehydrogenase